MGLPDGRYDVQLLMAEDAFKGVGQRVFTVTAEGRPVITDVDLFAVAGMHRAVRPVFTADVADGQLDLAFPAEIDNAVIAGMVIVRRS